jgi:hypothetical protein
MATTAPFVKLLRQLSAARDDYRTGALDLTWDGGTATLFLVFGQPNHATLETADGSRLEGQEALSALVHRLPSRFQVAPWRKAVVRTETLRCSLDELIEPFAQLAGAASPGPADEPAAAVPADRGSGGGGVDFGLEDFPLLPLGASLWADAAASVVHLDVLLPSLPDALVVLTGPRLRAAAVVIRQRLIDAVWVDDEQRLAGEAAAMALMSASQGSVSGYRLASAELGQALTMLWRCPVAHLAVPTSWVRAEAMLDDLEQSRADSALLVTGATRGVALLSGGRLIAVYSDAERQPGESRDRLLELVGTPGTALTVRRRAEERTLERLPEACFHAFVDAPAAAGEAAPGATAAPALTEVEAPLLTDVAAAPGGAAQPATPDLPVHTEEHAPAWAARGATPRFGETVEPGVAEVSEAPPAVAAEAWLPPPPPPPPPAAEEIPAPGWLAGLEAGMPKPAPEEQAASFGGAAAPGPAVWELPPDPALGAAWEPPVNGDGPDFDGVKRDLIQIGTLWLGEEGAAQAAELIQRARPSVEDIMSTIDAIPGLALDGQEPSVVQAMVREMRFHAAEYLSGL